MYHRLPVTAPSEGKSQIEGSEADMPDLSVLHHGAHSESARALQAAMNRRLRARDLEALVIEEDGTVGHATLEAVRKVAWALGALSETYNAVTEKGEISVGVQRMIRNPGLRTDAQRERGRIRMSQMRAERKRRAAAGSRSKAVNAFLAKVGTKESPAGSNGGGIITAMEAFWGFGRVPWCGIAVGYHAVKFGRVDGMRSDVASVKAIEDHARAGHAPYGRWQSSVHGALPGSLVVIGGRGVHVGMCVEAHADGSATTAEGNTSFGPGGSQSDGGCIARRHRSDAEIFGVATMNYPG
jgi:hypothetical protein